MLALWANMHGAFPAGLMLIGCFLAARLGVAWHAGKLRSDSQCRCLAACLAVSAAATLLNPYGWQIYDYVGATSNRAATRGIDEWLPPSLNQGIGVAFFVSLIALGLLIALSWRKSRASIQFRGVVLALCFLPMAATSVRMVAWWLLVMAPTAAVLLSRLLPSPRVAHDKPTLGAALTCVVLLLVAVSALPGLRAYNPLLAAHGNPHVERDLEVILERLAQEQSGRRIFTRFEWGEFIGWAAQRPCSIFMDGRIEIYPDKVWHEYEAVTLGRDWSRILDLYQVDALILDSDYHARTGLLAQVESSSEWVRTIEAGSALLYLRSTAFQHLQGRL